MSQTSHIPTSYYTSAYTSRKQFRGKGRNRTRHIIPPITNTPSNTYDYEYENENDGSDEENIYEFQPPKSKKIETQNIQQQQQQLLQSPPPDIQNFRNQFYKPVRTRRPSLRGRERVLLGNRRKLFQRTPSNNKPIKLSNREAFRVAESAANEIFSHEHEDDNKDMFDNENTSLIISIPGISSEELAQSFGTATGIENKRPRFGRLPFGSRNVKKNGTRSKIHVNNNHVGYFTNIQKGEDVETFEAYTEEFVEELQNLKSENRRELQENEVLRHAYIDHRLMALPDVQLILQNSLKEITNSLQEDEWIYQ